VGVVIRTPILDSRSVDVGVEIVTGDTLTAAIPDGPELPGRYEAANSANGLPEPSADLVIRHEAIISGDPMGPKVWRVLPRK
jgi:hypothetical protein